MSRSDLGVCGLLIAVTVFVYAPTWRFDFVNYDDPGYVKDNAFVAAGLSANSLRYAWTTFDLGNWIPVTWLSLELDAALFGLRPSAFHATNVVLHIANVLLFYVVLRRMTDAPGRCAMAAVLFAVHPLHVESVAWISERKDVLSTLGLLLTLLAYERYAIRPSHFRLVLVCIAFVTGLLAKSMLVTLPILLCLLDAWPMQRVALVGVGRMAGSAVYPGRTRRELFWEKAPLLLLSLVVGLVTVQAQRSTGTVSGLESLSILSRLGNAIHAYGWYLWKTIWPTSLCAFYEHPGETLPWGEVAVSAVVLIGISVLVSRYSRERRHLLFGWLWFLISLLPVVGLLQVGGQAHADRYSYVPHLGLFVLLIWEAEYWLGKMSHGKVVRWGLIGAVATMSIFLSVRQVATWRNSETLWSQVFAVFPQDATAESGMGNLRIEQGRWDEAAQHFQNVLARKPKNADAIMSLGWVHHQREEWQQAASHYQWALRINPQHERAVRYLAELLKRGVDVVPDQPLQRVIPEEALAQIPLGVQQARQGRMEEALKSFLRAIEIAPDFADAHNNAALALSHLNRHDEAVRHLRQALAIDPNNLNSLVNLAGLLETRGDVTEARQHYEAALRIAPNDPELRQRLKQLKAASKP